MQMFVELQKSKALLLSVCFVTRSKVVVTFRKSLFLDINADNGGACLTVMIGLGHAFLAMTYMS